MVQRVTRQFDCLRLGADTVSPLLSRCYYVISSLKAESRRGGPGGQDPSHLSFLGDLKLRNKGKSCAQSRKCATF